MNLLEYGVGKLRKASVVSEWCLVYTALLCLVFRLWVMVLPASLWLDETSTAWIVLHGPKDIVARTAHWPAVSPLYHYVAWFASAIGGRSEVALRLPSLILMAASAVFVFLIARRLMSNDAALFSVVLFVGHPAVAFAAADARPYALATCCFLWSTLVLLRWMETQRLRDAAGYAVLMGLAVHVHHVFAAGMLLHATWILIQCFSMPMRGKGPLLSLSVLAAIPMIAAAPKFLSIYQALGIFPTSGVRPTMLFEEVFSPGFVGAVVLGVLGAVFVGASFKRNCLKAGENGLLYIAAWIIVPSVTLFSASMILKVSLLETRYLVWVAPGLALLGGCIVGSIQQSKARQISIAIIAATLLMVFGSVRTLLPRHGNQDWRAALASAAKHSHGEGTIVLFHIPYFEGRLPDWEAHAHPSGFLMSPLAVYPVPGRILALPYEIGPTTVSYIEKLSSKTLVHSRKLVLVEAQPRTGLKSWLEGRLSPCGFRSAAAEDFGGPQVWVFDRPFSIRSVNSLNPLASAADR
jgi:mannosyltransferase